jgi:hypothetical protein
MMIGLGIIHHHFPATVVNHLFAIIARRRGVCTRDDLVEHFRVLADFPDQARPFPFVVPSGNFSRVIVQVQLVQFVIIDQACQTRAGRQGKETD